MEKKELKTLAQYIAKNAPDYVLTGEPAINLCFDAPIDAGVLEYVVYSKDIAVKIGDVLSKYCEENKYDFEAMETKDRDKYSRYTIKPSGVPVYIRVYNNKRGIAPPALHKVDGILTLEPEYLMTKLLRQFAYFQSAANLFNLCYIANRCWESVSATAKFVVADFITSMSKMNYPVSIDTLATPVLPEYREMLCNELDDFMTNIGVKDR